MADEQIGRSGSGGRSGALLGGGDRDRRGGDLPASELAGGDVDFLFSSTETPLIFALLIAGVLGFIIGLVLPRFRRRD